MIYVTEFWGNLFRNKMDKGDRLTNIEGNRKSRRKQIEDQDHTNCVTCHKGDKQGAVTEDYGGQFGKDS